MGQVLVNEKPQSPYRKRPDNKDRNMGNLHKFVIDFLFTCRLQWTDHINRLFEEMDCLILTSQTKSQERSLEESLEKKAGSLILFKFPVIWSSMPINGEIGHCR